MHRKVKPLRWLHQDRCSKANQSSQLHPFQRPTKMPTVHKHTSDTSSTLGWTYCFLLPDLHSETDSSLWIFFKCPSICGAPSQACHLKNHLSSARDIFLSVVTLCLHLCFPTLVFPWKPMLLTWKFYTVACTSCSISLCWMMTVPKLAAEIKEYGSDRFRLPRRVIWWIRLLLSSYFSRMYHI